MQRIIINADDFGINDIVTSEIEKMIEIGAITSTTIMANGNCLEEVKRFAISHPEISFGIHLCLSEFSSITKSKVLYKYGLTDSEGIFIKQQIFRVPFFPEDLLIAIKNELKAQIETVKSLGIQISHADSHHHVHTIYPLHSVVNEVLEEYGIKKIRLGTKVEPFYLLKMKLKRRYKEKSKQEGKHKESEVRDVRPQANNGLILSLKLILDRYRLNRFYKTKFTTTDSFYSYKEYVSRSLFKSNNSNVVELMCHPGHPSQLYKEEMALVESKVIITQSGIKAISYNDI